MILKDKVAIITGAGRGLGRASAIEMAKEGASLVILSRTSKELDNTAEKITKTGGKVITLKADVSLNKDIENTVDKAISTFGKIDILLNNAAILGPVKPLYKIDEKDWNNLIEINLKGVFLFSKAITPIMVQQKSGKIINVTSNLGLKGLPFFSGYSVAKAGIIHLTKILAEELKDFNIQVNGLDPGGMDTALQAEIRMLGSDILGRKIYNYFCSLKDGNLLTTPQKAAKLAVFLASDASNMITGKNGTESDYFSFGYRG